MEQKLQPDEQMWIDVGKLIREHVPDKNGKTLPTDLTSGSYEFRDLTDIGIGSLFEGKVIYDKTYGHVAYGCALCCGYTPPVVLTFDPLDTFLLDASSNGVQAYDYCPDMFTDVSSYFWNNWGTGDTSIATVDAYGTHTGVGVGSTSSATSGDLTSQTYRTCPLRHYTPSGTVRVISIVVNFTGSKTPGDNLSFLNAVGECSESLGPQDCTSTTGYRLWNLEGNARVYDDASNWTVQRSVQYHYVGYYRDSNNNLQPFSCTVSKPDGPSPNYLQQPAGQKSIFFIDGPGPYAGIDSTQQCNIGTSPVDSETDVLNFQVTLTSKITGYSRTVFYYVKIVISGGQLDYTNSTANYGNVSLNF